MEMREPTETPYIFRTTPPKDCKRFHKAIVLMEMRESKITKKLLKPDTYRIWERFWPLCILLYLQNGVLYTFFVDHFLTA